MCFVGHEVFKRKLNQLPMFLPFVKPLFVHSIRKGDWTYNVPGAKEVLLALTE